MAIPVKRIGMWASPRCLSTVLLRSWSNRADTFVQDEPLYPHYLLVSGREDPGRDAVLKNYETDWVKIVDRLTHGEIPNHKSIYYQKFMVYRLLPHIEIDWISELTNCFIIREPREMLLSYLKLWPNPTLETLGIVRLRELFYTVRDTLGTIPPVIDARDLRMNPRNTLSLLCEAIGVEFTEEMLHWPKGTQQRIFGLNTSGITQSGTQQNFSPIPLRTIQFQRNFQSCWFNAMKSIKNYTSIV